MQIYFGNHQMSVGAQLFWLQSAYLQGHLCRSVEYISCHYVLEGHWLAYTRGALAVNYCRGTEAGSI